MITLTKRLRAEAESSSTSQTTSTSTAVTTTSPLSMSSSSPSSSSSSRISIRDQLLVKEVQEMEQTLPVGCKVKFEDPNALHDFSLVIVPEEGSFWSGGKFRFHIRVPEEYNLAPPQVRCLTRLWHPNINEEGDVCLSILRQSSIDGMGWAPTRRLKDVIWGLNSLFTDLLNFDDPLNIDAAEHFLKDKEGFKHKVRDWISPAMGSVVEDSFCLKWNDFHTSVTSSFADLREEADLLDVTLICEGKPIMAHKLILSACSAVFKQMLRAARNAKDPTILLWDIRLEDMEALINFMYHGEVNITQEKLNHFLDLAERLQVRGLTSSGSGGEKDKQKQQQQHHQAAARGWAAAAAAASGGGANSLGGGRKHMPNLSSLLPNKPCSPNSLFSPSAASSSSSAAAALASTLAASGAGGGGLKRSSKRPPAPPPPEVIKDEPRNNDDNLSSSSSFTPPVPIAEIHTGSDGGSVSGGGNAGGGGAGGGLNDFQSESQFDSSFMDDSDGGGEGDGSDDEEEDERGGLPPLPQFLQDGASGSLGGSSIIEPIVSFDGNKEFPCHYCEKRYLTRSRLKRHVLDVHEKGEYPCPDCGKIFTSTRRLKDHQRSRYCHGQVRVIIS